MEKIKVYKLSMLELSFFPKGKMNILFYIIKMDPTYPLFNIDFDPIEKVIDYYNSPLYTRCKEYPNQEFKWHQMNCPYCISKK